MLVGHVRAPVEDAAFDPPDVGRAGRSDAVRRTDFHQRLPQVRAASGIEQVDLVPHLGGPAGPRHDHRDAPDLGVPPPVVLEIEDGVAQQGDHEVLRPRSLDLHRRDVRLADRDIELGVGVLEAAREEQRVRRRQREPERVLVHPRQDRIIDDPAVRVADEHVFRLPDLALRQVARGEQLRKFEPVRPGDLEAALDRDVPDGDVVEQGLEFRLERVEPDREVHVVVDREALRAVALGGLVVGRAPVAGAALDLAHVERRGGSHGGQGDPSSEVASGCG